MLRIISLLITFNLMGGCGDKSSSNKNSDSTAPTENSGDAVSGNEKPNPQEEPKYPIPTKPDVIKDPIPNPVVPPIEEESDVEDEDNLEDEDDVYTGDESGKKVYELCRNQAISLDAKLTYKILAKFLEENDCLSLSNAFISKKSYILDFNFLDYYERQELRNSSFDLSVFEKFPQLQSLVIANAKLKNPEALSAANDIYLLVLQDNKLKNIDFISNLNNLITLSLDQNQIHDLSPLRNLENLATFFANENQIIDLSPLSHISTLTNLSLNHNLIEDLTPLEDLNNLKEIEVEENKIKDCPSNSASAALMKLCRSL